MRISIYYMTGNYASIDTTPQSIREGVLLDDAYIQADDLEGEGVVVQRSVFTSVTEGRNQLAGGKVVIASPEELANISLIEVDGMPFLRRIGQDFERCFEVLDDETEQDEGPDEGDMVEDSGDANEPEAS